MVVNLFFYEWPHSFAATIAIIIVSNVAHHSVFKLFTKKKVKHLLETVYGVSFFLHSKNIPKTDSGSKEEKAISNCTLRMNHFVIKISIIQWLFRKLISAFCACPSVRIVCRNYSVKLSKFCCLIACWQWVFQDCFSGWDVPKRHANYSTEIILCHLMTS